MDAGASGLVVGGEPREPLVQSVSRGGAGRLDVPVAVADPGQAQLLLDLVGFHGWGEMERIRM